ncbi:transposase [Methylicorpusculum oleiharenae]|uniref:IS91 family transposase n=1 Tax=Methylicorpusculum oleiharenae TaxID=1338687 RepID=UPI00135864CE|nr:transposase [Methylicorpusculum oleiharenae]MCD2453525.1 transposase [Methylicorpusculum oleiharenae]MCD2453528.1 transposase [Methylicorpusculum oleiharenae]
MILLSTVIETFEADLLGHYQDSLLPSHRQALAAMKHCRTSQSPVMLAKCDDCDSQRFVPHSCGHRNCPHCQSHESQQWLERQLQRQVPAEYFLVTFTLPKELRALAWQQQRTLYSLMTGCSWETLKTFTQNDPQLKGNAGAITVLHTHSRRLDYHPHVHCVIPAAAIDTEKRLWRTKRGKKGQDKKQTGYLFNHKALAKVFRAKLLEAITQAGLDLPHRYPEKWVVDVKSVGSGDKALVYLGRYLYKGVIQEKDIVACRDGQVTFRYQDSKTRQMRTRTLPGAQFLWLILRHVLPKGFRRTRNFGFLHPNSKRLIGLLQYLLGLNPNRALAWLRKRPVLTCACCGGEMRIVKTRILPILRSQTMPAGQPG